MLKTLAAGGVAVLVLAGVFVFHVPAAVGYQVADWRAEKVGDPVVEANNAFGLELTRELASSSNGNVFISPLSVSSSLLMAYNGASNETGEAMASTLQVENMSKQQVRSEYRELLASLRGVDRRVTLQVANSVWIKDEFAGKVRKQYKNQVRSGFDAQLFVKPFNQQTASKMNGWVKRKTNGKISKVIDQFRSREVMFLVNALYFKGKWTDKFEESDTSTETFTTPSSTVSVPLMSQRDEFGYYRGDRFKLVRLPYGREAVAMYVILPREDDREADNPPSVAALLSNVSRQDIRTAMEKASEEKVELKLPKFETRYSKGLKQTLKALGMDEAFQRGGFDGIARDSELAISRVKHKTYVKVDEEGTEAAAVTATGITTTSAPRYRAFIADRPFFFMIRDDRTETILFSGVIRNPKQ